MNECELTVMNQKRGAIAKMENCQGENETNIGMHSQIKQSMTNCMVYIWNIVTYVIDWSTFFNFRSNMHNTVVVDSMLITLKVFVATDCSISIFVSISFCDKKTSLVSK